MKSWKYDARQICQFCGCGATTYVHIFCECWGIPSNIKLALRKKYPCEYKKCKDKMDGDEDPSEEYFINTDIDNHDSYE